MFLQEVSCISASDLKRFEFYATLVKQLELFQDPFDFDVISRWNTLTIHMGRRTLLPSLKHLIFNSGIQIGTLACLSCFLSPTLLSLQGSDAPPKPTSQVHAMNRLYEDIAFYCPALEELGVPLNYDDPGDTFHGPIALPVLPCYRSLSSMQNLRIFRTNVSVFEASALEILGNLPCLEKLEISEVSQSVFQIPVPTLPDYVFPALRELRLSNLDIGEFRAIWNIPQLATRPVVVEIELTESDGGTAAEELLIDICQRSPHMVDFTFAYKRNTRNLCADAFWSFKYLPLEKLSISGISLPSPDAICKILPTACPLLRELQLPELEATISDLRYFSQLSRLEFLSVSVNWKSGLGSDELAPEPLFVSPVFRQLKEMALLHSSLEPSLISETVVYVLPSIFLQLQL